MAPVVHFAEGVDMALQRIDGGGDEAFLRRAHPARETIADPRDLGVELLAHAGTEGIEFRLQRLAVDLVIAARGLGQFEDHFAHADDLFGFRLHIVEQSGTRAFDHARRQRPVQLGHARGFHRALSRSTTGSLRSTVSSSR